MVDDTPLEHAYYKQTKLIWSSLIFGFCEEEKVWQRAETTHHRITFDFYRVVKSIILINGELTRDVINYK